MERKTVNAKDTQDGESYKIGKNAWTGLYVYASGRNVLILDDANDLTITGSEDLKELIEALKACLETVKENENEDA